LSSLLHRGELESVVSEEGEGKFEAGVEKEVDKVDEALGLEGRVVLRREVLQGGKSEK
jgi:hypothetical protein